MLPIHEQITPEQAAASDTIIVYTDGGARGNPGPAASGAFSLQFGGRKKFLGHATNNVAEYTAVIIALEAAYEYMQEHPVARTVDCYLDSELIVKQMKREYKVKNPALQQLFLQVWNLTNKFAKVSFTHVPREQNKEADALVNEAIDEALAQQLQQ